LSILLCTATAESISGFVNDDGLVELHRRKKGERWRTKLENWVAANPAMMFLQALNL
jgi:hypothetical protein